MHVTAVVSFITIYIFCSTVRSLLWSEDEFFFSLVRKKVLVTSHEGK